MADPVRPRVLLIDDDEAITSTLGPFLSRSGFEVTTAGDGRRGVTIFDRDGADVVVLDVAMPELDGREVLRRLRSSGSWTPVVMLTQIGEAGERAMTLDEGADDYLNKPFDPIELVARVRSVLRRAHGGRPLSAQEGTLTAGPLRVDRVSHRVFLDEREVVLSPKAVSLLDFLISHPDELLTRHRLLEVVWGYEHPVGTRAVDNRVAELRRVLTDDAAAPRFIQTVPGQGYRFVADVDA
jgi:DNA-binding response OmpR family regulator